MRFTLLGSGTSGGVPKIGNDWGMCDPDNPKNLRSRVSGLITFDDGHNLLIDTSPDLRAQALANNIDRIDTVLWTHDHADHWHGIDDLRGFYHVHRSRIQGYASKHYAKALRQRFSYVFKGEKGYPSMVNLNAMTSATTIGPNAVVRHVDQPHGPVCSTGYRVDYKGKSCVYATDYSAITDEMRVLYDGCDLLICDCLREKPHPTHAHLDMALQLIQETCPGKAVLIHMDKSLDYDTLQGCLPENVFAGYDGLVIDLVNGEELL